MRVGGVKYTIKDGIVYDAKKLLADVRRMVKEAKDKAGRRCCTSRGWSLRRLPPVQRHPPVLDHDAGRSITEMSASGSPFTATRSAR